MKKIFLPVFISLIVFPTQGECVSKVVAMFDTTNTSISCQVNMARLNIKSINGYEVVSSDGCYQSSQIGKPSLPIYSFFVLLPPHSEIKDITLTKIDQIKLDGEYHIKPVSPPIPLSQGAKNRPSISQSEDFYPEKIVEVNSIQRLRGYTLACLSVFGACYNPKTKELTWNKQINFKLNLTSKDNNTSLTPFIKREDTMMSSPIRGLREDEDLVKRMIVNPELVNTYPFAKRLAPLKINKYVIITSDDLMSSFTPLCDSKPMTTIVTTSWIYNNYQGKDNQEKIKAFIKDYYTNYGTCYVLLGGDIDKVPYRGVSAKVPEGSNLGDEIDDEIPCDLYYACLDNDWNKDGDKTYGELEDDIDLMPEVYIGRAPVSNSLEAVNFVNKVIDYKNFYDDYIYNELLIAYKLDKNNDGKEIMEDIASATPATYTIYREYESQRGGLKSEVIKRLNSGVGLVAYAGHGSTITLQSIPSYITRMDMRGLENRTKTFIFNAIACLAGDFSQTDCIGEEMVLNPNGGAVAFIGNSRYGWYDDDDVKKYSGEYQIEFFKKLLKEGYSLVAEALALSKATFIPRCGTDTPYRWIMFCLNLLGDPAMEFRAAKEIFYIGHNMKEIIDHPGEVVDLVVTLKNLKDGTMTGVSATLTTTDEYITIIENNATFGDISPKGTATNSSNPYKIMVKAKCPSVHKTNFRLTISSDGYKYVDKFGVEINRKVETLDKVSHYPNPCYPDKGEKLTIANIPLNSNAKVYIYNLAGELIRTLDDEIQKYPGSEVVIWDAKNEEGSDVAFGIYIYVLKCDVGTKKGKIAIIR